MIFFAVLAKKRKGEIQKQKSQIYDAALTVNVLAYLLNWCGYNWLTQKTIKQINNKPLLKCSQCLRYSEGGRRWAKVSFAQTDGPAAFAQMLGYFELEGSYDQVKCRLLAGRPKLRSQITT
jgi:hypothetical protein